MSLIRSRVFAIWMLLVAATVVSIEFFRGFLFGTDMRAASIAVIVVAFIKVRFVGLEFMELRIAPWPMRAAFEVWCAAVAAAVCLITWFGG